jgi:hypothetical protein
MKNINYNTVYTGSSPELIELYVLGYDIQWFNEGYWLDVPSYNSEDGSDLYRVTNTEYTFRVKPICSYVFLHTNEVFKLKPNSFKTLDCVLFAYPKYKPAGPYVMFKVNNEGNVIDSYSSTDREVNDDDSFFKYS